MGYITDYYIGFSAENCIFPDTTFYDGNPICDWEYRCTYETDPTQIPSNQSNFLLYIDETCWSAGALAFFMGFANADGSDIRVTQSDGQTEIPFYVADIDTTAETISLYVLLSGISSFDPTTIQIYSGNAAASAYATNSPYGRDACFANQEIVIGLTEDPSGVPPQAIDWTGNLGSGTSQGGMVAGDLVDFQLGKGWEFDRASSQYVTGSDSNLPSGRTRRRISGWIEVALDGQFEGLFLYGKNNNGQAISVYKDTSDDWVVDIIGATLSVAAGAGTHKIDVVVPDMVTPRRDDIKFYLNGVEQVMATGGSNRVVNTILSEWIIASNIGKTLYNGKKVGPAYVEALERSDDYITAEYNNQSAPGTFGEITQCLTNIGTLSCQFPAGTFADGNVICDWSHRFEYNTDAAQITADQTNFLVYISEACFSAAALTEIMSNVKNGGGDIRLTLSDGSTEIPFYVQTCDTGTNTLRLWARFTGTLSSSVSSRIYIYTGNAAASAYAVTATYGRNNCFQDFQYFLGMDADPSGGTLTDWTGNLGNWTIDNMEAGDQGTQTNGMEAYTFDGPGGNERVYKDTAAYINQQSGAITVIVKINSIFGSNSERVLWGYGSSTSSAKAARMLITKLRNAGIGDSDTHFHLTLKREGSADFDIGVVDSAISNGATYMLSVVSTGAAGLIYVDGVSQTVTNWFGNDWAGNGHWFNHVNAPATRRVAIGDLYFNGAWLGANTDDTIGPVFQESNAPNANTQAVRNSCYVTPGTFGTVTSWTIS